VYILSDSFYVRGRFKSSISKLGIQEYIFKVTEVAALDKRFDGGKLHVRPNLTLPNGRTIKRGDNLIVAPRTPKLSEYFILSFGKAIGSLRKSQHKTSWWVVRLF